jgi:PPIC-type PPIASE domain
MLPSNVILNTVFDLEDRVMRAFLIRVFKEPLFHFMFIGCAIFVAYELAVGDQASTDNYNIVVDRSSLAAFMQYRSKAVNTDQIAAKLDNLSSEQRQVLVDQYVQEEVLYREAKALNLDKSDYVARLRLIRQFKYLTSSFIGSVELFTEAELEVFFAKNISRYSEPEKRTFTHVFFNTKERTPEQTETLAQQQLQTLNNEAVPFHQSMAHGERFLYHSNYVNKDAEFIASHFSEPFQQAVFELPADNKLWQGPFQSAYGYHLVLVSQQTPVLTPLLQEVRGRVAADLTQEKTQQKMQEVIASIREQYTVSYQDDLPKVATLTEES